MGKKGWKNSQENEVKKREDNIKNKEGYIKIKGSR